MARREILRPEDAQTLGGRRLRELALVHTFSWLAKRARCDETSIRRWAQEEVTPSSKMRVILREAFGIAEGGWSPLPDAYREPATTKRGSHR